MSEAYGWTDEVILDLTVRRFRQIVAAIQRRKYLRRREEISLVSWQTRQQVSFTAGGYMVDGKKGNPALDAAQKLAFDEIEAAQMEEARVRREETDRERGLVYNEKGEIINVVATYPEPKPASYERFMGSFGDRTRWKG